MKFRKKPVVIEAIQWKGNNERDMFDFLTNGTKKDKMVNTEEDTFRIDLVNGGCSVGNLMIKTLEGDMKANINDYVIKGVNGEFYPCKPDIFLKTYEIAEIETEKVVQATLDVVNHINKHQNFAKPMCNH